MPYGYYIILIKRYSLNSFFDCLRFQPVVFNNNDFRVYLDFRRHPLILHMNVNWLVVIGVKEKSYSKYE